MKAHESLLIWGLFSILTGGWGATSEAADLIETIGDADGDRAFAFRVNTPPLILDEPVPGSFEIDLEGFRTPRRRPGAPSIPTHTFLVALPPGVTPRLEVRVIGEAALPSIRPRPVPRRLGRGPAREIKGRPELPKRQQVVRRYEADPAIYHGGATYPERPAWLGETGVLRSQRYVQVHVAPVRYDPRSGGLVRATALEIEVRFDGTPGGEPRSEPRFESVYRRAFLNYEQGLSFRLPDHSSPAPSTARDAAGRITRGSPAPVRRILVSEDGIVRLDESLFSGDFLTTDLSMWRLTNRGVQVPLQIEDDGDGLIEPGEWVQFYGQALTDEPKTVLHTDVPGSPLDLYEHRDYTDVNTYFLTLDMAVQPAMSERDAAPAFSLTPPAYFTDTAHVEVDDAYRPLASNDPWYWLPSLSANGTTKLRTESIALPGLHSGTLDAQVRVNIRGLTEEDMIDPDHHTRITVRNSGAQLLEIDDRMWDARIVELHDFNWTWPGSGAQLTDPVDVDVEAVPVGGGDNDVILDYIEIDYPRDFTPVGDLLFFEWPDGDAEFEILGVSDLTPEIYEITLPSGQNVVQPVRLLNPSISGPNPFCVRFRMDNDLSLADGTPRRFVLVGDAAVNTPAMGEFLVDTVSTLRDNARQADYIVIAHPDVLDTGGGAPLTQLLAHRATAAGGGFTTTIVMLEDVQDEFNDGLPGPVAIREFLRWVMSTQPGEGWAAPKPTHVMLLGDGTYDYKGGTASGGFIPTQIMFKDLIELGYYSSDHVNAAVVGSDPMADLVVGRIPARDVATANLILQKILDYETAPAGGSWTRHSLFVSDRGKTGNNPAESLDFEGTNADAIAFITSPYTNLNLRYWTDYYDNGVPNPDIVINGNIDDSINGLDGHADGAVVTQFIGHGNTVVWSDDAFWDERSLVLPDTIDLTNGSRLPWLLAHNCLTGGFHLTNPNTLGENWLSLSGGGAVGVFSPSGLSFSFIGDRVSADLWGEMYGPTKERSIGTLATNAIAALCGTGAVEPCQHYIILGDPATRLALRSVEPPTAVQATAGNAQIDLSWTASTTGGVTYDVYRAGSLANPNYFKLNGSPVAGTMFTDSGVTNTTTYYYYVVAIDAQGFESRWSNFNSDCGMAGPDCVQATPLNPNPPSIPTGLVVQDPGYGTQLQLSWNANPENDLAFYTLHYGVAQGVYDSVLPLGKVTGAGVIGLTEGVTYYFALSATNTSGMTSALSAETSESAVTGLGLRSPRLVTNLMVNVSGADLVLDWDEVTTDIADKSESVDKYEILRGIGGGFNNSGLAFLAQCTAPCSSYTDTGAATDGNQYYYRVRALDFDGNRSGLGSEPPRSTTLSIARSQMVTDDLALSWTPVTTDHGGLPVSLQHYAIYAADQPFTREDIRDGLVLPMLTVTGTGVEITPPGQDRYYSVLAVDIRGNLSPF